MTRRGYHQSSDHIKKRIQYGESNGNWRGKLVSLEALHIWVKRRLIKPNVCEICKVKPPYDLANISGEYKRDLDDWEYLCRSCHMIKDGRMDNIHRSEIHINNEILNRICSWCGRNTCINSKTGRPIWRHIDHELVCASCYTVEWRRLKNIRIKNRNN